ncbi:MAG: phosphoglucomutase/phosphomannomutase family protein [candidate division NC10 bacterium]|nr:phosphoglucomutase/phosphomannomutase family protein [candidate division NC10 bacterium]
MIDIRFGTDGWRGVIADDFTFANVRLVARAIARRVRAEVGGRTPHVLVGHDTRFLSREFAQAAAEAMAGEGVQVSLTAAFAPTPAFSYAVVRLRAAGAVVITASHNPAEYNGVKFKSGFGGSAPVPFTRSVEEEIRRLRAESRAGGGSAQRIRLAPDPPEADREPRAASHQPGAASREPRAGTPKFEIRNSKFEIGTFDPREPWLDRLEELVDVSRIGRSGIRVALDVMYGAGQGLLSERLGKAGAEVRELHGEINPGFGGLHPEPIPAYMGALMDCVKGWGGSALRVGFAFDGDSDRVAPVDEDGIVVTPHQTLALLVRHLVQQRGMRGAVVKSVNIGHLVAAEVKALGLPLVVTPVGFKFIAEAMRKHDAVVGGEESGGFAVRGHIPERDPGLISLLLLECMAMTGKSLGTLVREMEAQHGSHRYGRLDLRLPSLEARDHVVATTVASPPGQVLSLPVHHVETMDGVKLTRADHSWVMLRASGTEPLLRIYAEAPTEGEVNALLAWGRAMALGGGD